MQIKSGLKMKILNKTERGLLGIFALFALSTTHVHATTEYIKIEKNHKIIADVVHISQLDQLQLFLNNSKQQPYNKFKAVAKGLPKCQILSFAMNAGMYHADYSAVGLYVENSKQLSSLNTQTQGFGNFLMQPNGVLAWNKKQATIQITQHYAQSNFKADYATQSGPMLVIEGKINRQFLPQSDSLKIRNGVGIKNNQLYFVISRERISFYDFAQIFKEDLNIDQALYLDGSISSAYIPQAGRSDNRFNLGPIVGFIEQKNCQES